MQHFFYTEIFTMRIGLVMAVVLLWLGCKNREEPASVNQNKQPPFWADYKVWATEGDSMATCLLQFYTGPKKRQAIRLPAQAAVLVDGVPLTGDSAGMSGVFYEYRAPLASFAGPHIIEYRDDAGRRFVDRFQYVVFSISALRDQGQNGYLINLEGLPEKSLVRVALTDTAFDHEGYNEFLPVKNGKLTLDSSILGGLKNGPVQLHVAAEKDALLKSGLRGSISVAYTANRSFELAQ